MTVWFRGAGSAGLIAAVAITISGCAAPSLNPGQKAWQAPTASPWKGPPVQVLVNHITCRLILDYAKRATEDSAWTYLSKYHFVAAVNLNLSVTNNEGFNPSLSFMQPLTGGGQLIHPIVANSTASMGDTSGSYSRSLAVSGQFTGTQTNSVTYIYQIDMQQVANVALLLNEEKEQVKIDAILMDRTASDQRKAWAINEENLLQRTEQQFKDFVKGCQGGDSGFDEFQRGDLMQGDLAISDNIDDGLGTLNAISPFDIYGTSGPTNRNDINNLNAAVAQTEIDAAVKEANDRAKDKASKLEAAAEADDMLDFLASIPPGILYGDQAAPVGAKAGNAPKVAAPGVKSQGSPAPGGGPQGSGASATSFGSVVTFNINTGISGGPNWTLLLFKGPSGGGSGGSGGGSGGGGGSTGGAGGGQLLNFSRATNDSFTVTFAPTCKTNDEYPLSFEALPAASLDSGNKDPIKFEVAHPEKPKKDDDARHYLKATGTLALSLTGSLTSQNTGMLTGTGSIQYNQTSSGAPGAASVAWTMIRQANGVVHLYGSVSDLFTQAKLGTIVLAGTIDEAAKTVSLSGYMTDDVYDKLADSQADGSYWNTIAGCDVTAPDHIQSVITNAASNSRDLSLQSKLAGF